MANKGEQVKPNDQLTNQAVNQLTDYHIPVLLNETIVGLNIKPAGVYVDCTFGGGGHSRFVLQQLNEDGKLFVFDQDADAKKNVPDDERLIFIPPNFRYVERFLLLHQISFL